MQITKNTFIDYGFDDYIVSFQEYYNKNPDTYYKQLEVLLSYLDDFSSHNIKRFLQLMLKLPLPSRDFKIRAGSIYDTQEMRQIYEEDKYKKEVLKDYYDKYNLYGWEKTEVNVFKYHCGLKKISKEITKRLQNTIFIDGGAFWGDSMLVLHKYNPSKIICFEPNTVNFNNLIETVRNNKLRERVDLYKIGLSNKKENLKMNFISNRQNHGASIVFRPFKYKQEEISLNSLDNLLSLHLKVGLIKLDVEGYGLQAIQGAENIIKNNLPLISCAIYHNPEELFNIVPLLQSYNSNYKFLILPLSQAFILKELTLIAWV